MSKFSELDCEIEEIRQKFIKNPLIDDLRETLENYFIQAERCVNMESGGELVKFGIYTHEGKRVACIARDLPAYKTIRLYRNPTPAEIRRGYGAIHYLDFPVQLLEKKGGGLKKWTISQFDGLRYYR